MGQNHLHIPYTAPVMFLVIALGFKIPTFLRAWRDPDVRSTVLLLLLASGVFVSVVPASIHKINVVTGVPNIAAPWCYSLLTAFCATCLNMIIRWREEPSARRRRRMHRIRLTYTGIVIAFWVTFALANVPDERIYDLDTYYASTPWMREHILLYLIAHMVSTLVAAYMIWTWISEVKAPWLKPGLVFLQAGYAFGLLFDVAKLVAVSARWGGTDWDFLSTRVAPPFALLAATLVAIGFILPQVGPYLQQRFRDQATYRRLRALSNELQALAPSSAKARVGRFAPIDLRLLEREQRIQDGLLRLAPYIDDDLHHQAYEAAREAGHSDVHARGIAGAVVIRVAIGAAISDKPLSASDEPAKLSEDLTGITEVISRAMIRPRLVDTIHQRVSTESMDTHV